MNPDVFKKLNQLTADEWQKIIKLLGAYALLVIARYRYLSRNTDQLPKGNTVDDMVQTVITKTLSGERKWVPEKGELLPWMYSQIRSEVDNLFKSFTGRKEIKLQDASSHQSNSTEQDEVPSVSMTDIPDKSLPNPMEALLKEEKDADIGLMVDKIFKAASKDPDVESMLMAIMDGFTKPRFLAEHLGVPIEEIRNRYKRLRRLAMPFK